MAKSLIGAMSHTIEGHSEQKMRQTLHDFMDNDLTWCAQRERFDHLFTDNFGYDESLCVRYRTATTQRARSN